MGPEDEPEEREPPRGRNSSSPPPAGRVLILGVVILLVGGAFMLGAALVIRNGKNQSLTTTLAILGAGSIILAALFGRIEGRVEIGLRGLSADMREIGTTVDDLQRRVAALTVSMMSSWMYGNLEKLATDHFGKFEKSSGLVRELRLLRDLGLIEMRSAATIDGTPATIGRLPASGEDLSEYVRVSPTGYKYLALRRALREE